VNHGGPDSPPILLVHGDMDLMVPLEQGDKLYESLRSKGAEIRYCVARGGRHLITESEIIVCDLTGVGVQDVAAASLVMERAKAGKTL
jgi:ornithine cyclodeaminase/alanine dehydrogenase-like protein (mu-crystallin family)